MLIDDYIEPAVLTGFVREVPYPYQLILNTVLPDRYIADVEAAFDQVERTNRAASYRAWDSEVPVSQREGFQRSKVALPPLGVKLPIGEYERLMLERIRTGGDNRSGYVEAIYNDAEQLTREIFNRMELARGDVLMDGKFTLTDENGLTIEADFKLPAGHSTVANTLWSDHANAAPLQDLKAWVEFYLDENGERPATMLTSTQVLNNLLLAGEIRELFYRGDAVSGGPNLLTMAQLNTVLNAYGLPAIETYDTKIEVEGVNTRVIDQDKAIFLPADRASLGFTAWGITAEALELANGQNPGLLFQDLPGLVGVTLKEGDPLRVWTKVGAAGMPMLTNPRKLFVAEVL
ncbi:major capsid protein E [Micromonospora fluostatini]|uniref:Major capsid protein E n=1 Tax=Micromonospora fluostatini TaxID=1629071 RepID=A0ABY2DIV9_9ACTN|nr:major capsid protein E [Micromonospora fluostatini]